MMDINSVQSAAANWPICQPANLTWISIHDADTPRASRLVLKIDLIMSRYIDCHIDCIMLHLVSFINDRRVSSWF